MKQRATLSRSIKSITAISLLSSCGLETESSSSRYESDNDLASATSFDLHEDAIVPPDEYYKSLLEQAIEQDFSLAPSPYTTLYVNFRGANVRKGYGVGESFIVCRGTATVPPAGFPEDKIKQIVDGVQAHLHKVKASVRVVSEVPDQRPYVTIHVGGTYRNLGCMGGPLGIAPLDSGDRNKNDVGYVFSGLSSNTRTLIDAIAHEAGHTWGFNHVRERTGIMYPTIQTAIIGYIVGSVGARRQDEPNILRSIHGTYAGAFPWLDAGNGNSAPQPPIQPQPSVPPLPPGGGNNPIIPDPQSPPFDPIANLDIFKKISDLLKSFQMENLPIGDFGSLLKGLRRTANEETSMAANFGGAGSIGQFLSPDMMERIKDIFKPQGGGQGLDLFSGKLNDLMGQFMPGSDGSFREMLESFLQKRTLIETEFADDESDYLNKVLSEGYRRALKH